MKTSGCTLTHRKAIYTKVNSFQATGSILDMKEHAEYMP
jgi:hypothetical protein